MRAFVAVHLDDATRAALRARIESLQAAAPAVAWVNAENLHVTLKFLGTIQSASLEGITAGLGAAARQSAPFELVVRGLGAFPGPTSARVIWAGVTEGRDAMRDLAARVEAALEPIGFPTEPRPFSAHVTLGRIREPRRAARLAELIAASAAVDFGRVRVRAMALMRSDLSPRGARYSKMVEVSLSGH